MELSQILGPNHPSFGCNQAYFQFAFQTPDGAVRKILLVEAVNAYAVACIEYLLGMEGKVSDTCSIMCVVRHSADFGYRSDLIEVCSYPDFLLDIVDSDKLLKDPVSCHLFSHSLTTEERQYILDKSSQIPVEHNHSVPPDSTPARKVKKSSNKTQTPSGERETIIISAMTQMGFQKTPVTRWVESKGHELYEGSIQDKIREALAALAS